MTKKQIKALQDIIADLQRRRDYFLSIDNENRTEKNEPPLLRKIAGEQKTPTGYMVTDGYVGVFYHEPVAELPHADDYELSDEPIRSLIEDQLENGDYYLVSAPFSGDVKSSKIRDLLKQNAEAIKLEKGRILIRLTADTGNGQIIESHFNALYVRRAVEAIGGTVRLYIGQHRHRWQPHPFLIVTQEDSDFNLDSGTYAIVMPVARR